MCLNVKSQNFIDFWEFLIFFLMKSAFYGNCSVLKFNFEWDRIPREQLGYKTMTAKKKSIFGNLKWSSGLNRKDSARQTHIHGSSQSIWEHFSIGGV